MTHTYDAIVVGGGQAGLAAGYHLERAGLRFAILEGQSRATGSWGNYYDSLTLFSPARFASLPGLSFPGDPEHYPHRDEVVDYLALYGDHFGLPIEAGVWVKGVTASDRSGFIVETADGARLETRALIAATGTFGRPNLPQRPGQADFRGEIIHSADYRNPAPFEGRRVVVVGAGNTAMQVAFELAEVAEVTLASREPVVFFPQRLLGQDLHFWSRFIGESLPLGHWIKGLREPVKVLDTGIYREALATNKPRPRPMFESFEPTGVVWGDGERTPVDAVIYATGYRPSLGYLRSLGALSDEGMPLQRGGVSQTHEGLYYMGVPGQRTIISTTIRGVGADAAYVVRRLAAAQRQDKPAPSLTPLTHSKA